MERTQSERTPEFLEGLDDPEFVQRFCPDAHHSDRPRTCGSRPRGLGVLGHVLERIVLGRGRARYRRASEQHARRAGPQPARLPPPPAGRRMPSMMSPTVVLREARAEPVPGSAGSNRIRSAILQTIIRVIDDGLEAGDAVRAPRVHFEDGIVYAEPGIDTVALEARRPYDRRVQRAGTCSSVASRPPPATGRVGSPVVGTPGAAGPRWYFRLDEASRGGRTPSSLRSSPAAASRSRNPTCSS